MKKATIESCIKTLIKFDNQVNFVGNDGIDRAGLESADRAVLGSVMGSGPRPHMGAGLESADRAVLGSAMEPARERGD